MPDEIISASGYLSMVEGTLDSDSDPIRISIQTRKTDSGSEIIVSDNGPGFDPTDDDRPRIALVNIRQRLELMCGGKVMIMIGQQVRGTWNAKRTSGVAIRFEDMNSYP